MCVTIHTDSKIYMVTLSSNNRQNIKIMLRDLALPNIKTYNKNVVFITLWFYWRNRKID